jgi:hypothetical protein
VPKETSAIELTIKWWRIAAGLERCALGWRLDAQRYKGRRREWREERADALMTRAYALLGLEA